MKTSFKLSTLFVLAALVSAPFALATDPAPAAPPAPDAGARPHPMMRHMMQRRLEFLTEKLNLTEDQRTKIKAIWKQSAGQVKALRDEASLAREDLRAKADAMRKANRDQVRAVLTPEQQAIFDQLPADGPGRPGGKKDNDS
jgi:Spy/CpxP family protein refolding chaperone